MLEQILLVYYNPEWQNTIISIGKAEINKPCGYISAYFLSFVLSASVTRGAGT